ncbi:MAG: ribosome small subunit-dependent GTPase A [Eubacterium sp.]|nr:ribosome small subunit-dependent GTPase A [Eubacterium sp.]
MKGKIYKGIAGFYYVHTKDGNVWACKAKGIFRKEGIRPLVGDDVEIEITHEGDMEGNITEILPRKNSLIRPAVANADFALVIFAVKKPDPNFYLLDRFLVTMEKQNLPVVICFNKIDFSNDEEMESLRALYEPAGYKVIFISAKEKTGLDNLLGVMKGKTAVVAGPSGVGKSTTINALAKEKTMETGEISKKLGRGKHTTRHSEIIEIAEGTYIIDTPGFTSLNVEEPDEKMLSDYFPEMREINNECRFAGCAHIKEPGCKVKEALEEGKIPRQRYEHYCMMYEEIKDKRKY